MDHTCKDIIVLMFLLKKCLGQILFLLTVLRKHGRDSTLDLAELGSRFKNGVARVERRGRDETAKVLSISILRCLFLFPIQIASSPLKVFRSSRKASEIAILASNSALHRYQ